MLVAARRASSARYALRNTLVTVALSAMMLLLCFYVLHTMTFADPWFALTYRRHARVPGRLFHQLPDVHAMAWAFGIVGGYYFITLTVRRHLSKWPSWWPSWWRHGWPHHGLLRASQKAWGDPTHRSRRCV